MVVAFRLRCPSLSLSKFASQLKLIQSCGAGRDTRSLCHKFNFQGPALEILGLRAISPKSQGPSSGALGVRVPCPRALGPRVPGPRIQGPRIPGPESQGRGFRASDPGFRLCLSCIEF